MMTIRKQENKSSDPEKPTLLPTRRRQNTALLHAPRQSIKTAVERSASLYYDVCRRLARILNRNR